MGNDRPRELYESFRRDALSGRNVKTYYDEDDLFDIFNYAFDENDDFVKLEVLNVATRLYPDNKEFMVRKAMLLDMYSMTKEARELINGLGVDTPHAQLVKLRVSDVDDAQVREGILAVTDGSKSLTEDDVIEMCELAVEHNLTLWLISVVDRIAAKCSYPPTLYYELALNTYDTADYKESSQMAERLVDSEPMNADFWELYADVALMSTDYSRALNGAEYALAINPDSIRAASIKGQAMYYLKQDTGETRRVLDRVLRSGDKTVSHHVALILAILDDDTVNSRKPLVYFLENVELNRDIIVALAIMAQQAAASYLKNYVRTWIHLGVDYFAQWAAEQCRQGHLRIASDIMLEYDLATSGDLKPVHFYDMMYELLYRAGRYDEIVLRMSAESNAFFSPPAEMARLLSILRTDGRDSALEAARLLTASVNSIDVGDFPLPSMDIVMRHATLGDWCRRFIDSLADGSSAPFDPFIRASSDK